MATKRRVFDSVFQFSANMSEPTPDLGFTAPGQPFGGPVPFAHDRTQAPESLIRDFRTSMSSSAKVRDQVTWDRSWHTATYFLNLPFIAAGGGLEADAPLPIPGPGFYSALQDVLDPGTRLPHASHTENLISWYSQQVRYHFVHEVLAVLSRAGDTAEPEALLPICVKILERAHRSYLHGFSFIVYQLEDSNPGTSDSQILRFRRDLHAIVSNSISPRISEAVKALLGLKICIILGVPYQEHIQRSQDGKLLTSSSSHKEEARDELLNLIEALNNVGLGGENMKIIFAEVMNDAMTEYISRTYGHIWSRKSPRAGAVPAEDQQRKGEGSGHIFYSKSNGQHPPLPQDINTSSSSQCVAEICGWIENTFSTLVQEVLRNLEQTEVDWTQVEKWKKMSIGRLAGLRTEELFDIVVSWPNSDGALDDLRTAIDTPQRRLNLTDVFSMSLKERLLHPGASTLQILRTYISMIWSFHSLDHSKVLLDRVAFPLQEYLRSREDTVKIIITGLLSDREDSSGVPIEPGGERLTELATLLNKGSDSLGRRADEDLDWNDIEWVPDPVDAGPGYRRSKSADVIGTLIGVLGSQEVFIKEFQNIIGDTLLKSEGNFEKEVKVLELLKTRFGEAPLQSCEVMLKDIQDSSRVDGVIRRNQQLDPSEREIEAARARSDMIDDNQTSPEGLYKPSLHAKILSRLFWPQLNADSYRVPDDIGKLQELYERGFESLKNSRKLTWLQGLGQATVELELRDRVILKEAFTWQATVIWAFGSDDKDETSKTKTVQELVEELEMEEALVRSALKFWTHNMILQEIRKDEYAVLETLNKEDRARSDAQAAAAGAAPENIIDESARLSGEDVSSEKMQIYWQFIQGMLTNSMPQMPLQQIAMMLKMLIVDGFPYSNEELQEFLARKVVAGELELVKGKYKLKK